MVGDFIVILVRLEPADDIFHREHQKELRLNHPIACTLVT
jgi:hypothetical protein